MDQKGDRSADKASDQEMYEERLARAQEGFMSHTVVERAAEHIAESAHQASRATGAIANAIGDRVEVAMRTAKHGGDAAEDFLNDTTRRLQRHRTLTVVTTFAIGIAAGALVRWMVKRR